MRRRKVASDSADADHGSRRAGSSGAAFEQFREGLLRFLLRRLGHVETAQDLAQEVYLRLLRFADHELVRQPGAYVYRVAYHVLCEFSLHERRSPVTFDSRALEQLAEDLPVDAPPVEDLLERRDREQRLEAVLAQLPAMQRSVFLLAVRHDLPHEEVAARLGLSLHTVRKYLYRTLQHCRQHLRVEPSGQDSSS